MVSSHQLHHVITTDRAAPAPAIIAASHRLVIVKINDTLSLVTQQWSLMSDESVYYVLYVDDDKSGNVWRRYNVTVGQHVV